MAANERTASHAGSWYSHVKNVLEAELNAWLGQVSSDLGRGDVEHLPVPRARIIIAPHAGYSYSGPAAAWAYKALDLSNIKRVFVLGPSHHVYLDGCALTAHRTYATPLGSLAIDSLTTSVLRSTNKFTAMSPSTDSDEHSIEMHLPYIYKRLAETYPDDAPDARPPIVPILVGALNPTREKEYGEILAPYLTDPQNAFVISSDFCHWGSRFSYTYYKGSVGDAAQLTRSNATGIVANGGIDIHESIARLDKDAMAAIETGSHDAFVDYLKETKNTVCGRHPIGVVMAGLERVRENAQQDGTTTSTGTGRKKGMFTFVRYEQSSSVMDIRDSSVSYASAFAVI